MNHTKFLTILFWEMLENAAMLIGFILALRFWTENISLALVYLLLGAALGAVLIHFTEIKKFSNQPTLKETLVNFVVFMLLSIPFVFYFSAKETWWSNWIMDILLGIVAGGALAVAESWGWKNTATLRIHMLSMAVAFVLFLWGLRFTAQFELLTSIFTVGIVLNFFVSIVIVLFDYWPIKTAVSEIKSPPEEETDHQQKNNYTGMGEPGP